VALLALTGCTAALRLPSQIPTTAETLDGNYRTLAACTYQRLDRQQGRLRRSDLPDQEIVRIASEREWQMSFINEEAGRQTRVEMTSQGTQASDYALAIARACAA